MSTEHIVGFLVLLLTLALISEPLARKVGLPHSSLMVLLGVVTGYGLTLGLGVDTGLRASNFHDLIFFVLLPVLIFEAAFKMPLKELGRNLSVVLLTAIVGMSLTTLVAAVFLYSGIGHATGFPLLAALLAGALLAATDPVAVVAQLKSLGAPERLAVLLEGESLFNDATAIVLFSMFLTLATVSSQEISVSSAVFDFTVVFTGGILVGIACGSAAYLIYPGTVSVVQRATVTLCTAYGSFLIAEAGLHVSGVMATLTSGLIMAALQQKHPKDEEKLEFLWSTIAYLANGCVFLLMGITVTISMFQDRWLAMLIAIFAILIARVIAVFGTVSLTNLFIAEPVTNAYQGAMVWGGLRGAVTLALAFSLPLELPYWYTIQSMAFGVVLFTLFIQAPTMPVLLRQLGIVTR